MHDVDDVIKEWQEYQLSIRNRALFEDEDEVDVENDESASAFNDFDTPIVHHLPQRAFNFDLVGGIDISPASQSHNECIVTIVVLSTHTNQLLYTYHEKHSITEPYIPSYLGMRESGPIRATYANFVAHILDPIHAPTVYLIDGNGRLHDREAGLATQIGVEMGIRTVGVSKNYYPVKTQLNTPQHWRSNAKLFKGVAQQQLKRRGDWIGLFGGGSQSGYIGAALLSGRKASNPIFVSAGHRCSLQYALHVSYALSKHRVPEPIILADKAGRQYVQTLSKL